MTNELIVPYSSDRPPLDEWYKSFQLIGPAVGITQSDNGAGALMSACQTSLDLYSTLVDPLGTLMSSVAHFMIDYVWPIPEILDMLVGNPTAVGNMSLTWTNIQDTVTSAGEKVTGEVSGTVGSAWIGDAADRYKGMMEMYVGTLTSIAGAAGGIATMLAMMSDLIALIREIIEQLLSDLVGKLISYATEVLCTFGLGTPVVIAQATPVCFQYIKSGQEWSDRMSTLAENVTKNMDNITKLLTDLGPLVLKSVTSVRDAGNIANFVDQVTEFTYNLFQAPKSAGV
jgi:hypothetical protein